MPRSPIADETTTDFKQLADTEFLAERRRVREALEGTPEESPDRAGLAARYDALTAEFDRRAAAKWKEASCTSGTPR